jgi:hypothetical protein
MAKKKTASVETAAIGHEPLGEHQANITIDAEVEYPFSDPVHTEPTAAGTALAVPAPANPAIDTEGPREEPPKQWGPPYKAIFTCQEQGFELGENRRFKQRVFTFAGKPDPQILSDLKENGFTYWSQDKSWTIPANLRTRILTDDLARKWAGPAAEQGMER